MNAEDFKKAMGVALTEFEEQLKGLMTSWLPARVLVIKAIEKRFDLHPSGRIIELDSGCPFTVSSVGVRRGCVCLRG